VGGGMNYLGKDEQQRQPAHNRLNKLLVPEIPFGALNADFHALIFLFLPFPVVGK
jgi:hypothetical protein